jgi:hypothetical protein
MAENGYVSIGASSFSSAGEGAFEININCQLRPDKNIKYRTQFFYGRTYIAVSLIRYNGEHFAAGALWDVVKSHLKLKPARAMPSAWPALLSVLDQKDSLKKST